MSYVRREHFNQWYRLSSYFLALITTQIPDILILSTICSAMLYFVTDQPLQLFRFLLFVLAVLLTCMTASSYGLAISSRLNLLVFNYYIILFIYFNNLYILFSEFPLFRTMYNIMLGNFSQS